MNKILSILILLFVSFLISPSFGAEYQRKTPLSLERAKLKRQYIKIISNHTITHAQKCSLLADEFRGDSFREMSRKINTVLQMNCDMWAIYRR